MSGRKKDSRIKVIHIENNGVSFARNAGIKASSGSYVAFADSDDWLEPDMLEFLLHNAKVTGADVTCCSYLSEKNGDFHPVSFNSDGKFLSRDDRIVDLFKNVFLSGSACNKLYSRSVISGIYFQEDISMCEDILFNYEIYSKNIKVFILPDCKYHYFKRNDSSVSSGFVKNSFDYLKVKKYILETERTKSPNIFNQLLKQYILSAFTVVSSAARLRSDNKYFQNARNAILLYKKQVLFGNSVGLMEKSKTFLLWVTPNLYKFIIKVIREK